MSGITTGNNDAYETPSSSPKTAEEFANAKLQTENVRDDPDEVEIRCGYWQCRPDAFQKCNNPNALQVSLCCFTMTQGNL